jgi:hypothetical protein
MRLSQWRKDGQITERQQQGKVINLIDRNGNILFEEKEKSNELQRKLFEGKHLLEETFDKEFYDQTIQ